MSFPARPLLLASALACLLSGRPVSLLGAFAADNPLPSSAADTIDTIIPKILETYGGQKALARLGDNCTRSGQEKVISPVSGAGNLVRFIEAKKGDKLRIDIILAKSQPEAGAPHEENAGEPEIESTTVYDGKNAWRLSGKVVSELKGEAFKLMQEEGDHSPTIFARWQDPQFSFRLLGRTLYQQHYVYGIEVQNDGHDPVTFFVDEHTYLICGLSYTVAAGKDGGKPVNVSLEFSDWRSACGSMVAFRETEFADGSLSRVVLLEKIDPQTAVEESQFERPESSEPMRLPHPITIPFTYLNNEILLKVRLNGGEPLDFLLDTGASRTVVDRRVAATLLLDREGKFDIASASGSVSTQVASLNKVDLGGLKLDKMPALVLDLTPQSRQLGRLVAGIIGNDVLGQFVVTIDYGHEKVRLDDAASFQPSGQALAFGEAERPVVKVLLSDKDEELFLVDTGAALNELPGSIAKNYARAKKAHFIEGAGLDGSPVELASVKLPSVGLGGESVKDVEFVYDLADGKKPLRQFSDLSNCGVLGNPFWQNFTLTLDYQRHRLFLQMNPLLKARQDIAQLLSSGDDKLVVMREFRSADALYRKALVVAQGINDAKQQAIVLGRLGNMHRMMAKDLNRPEQTPLAVDCFTKSLHFCEDVDDQDVKARVLADFSLLYSDCGQSDDASRAIAMALKLGPDNAKVNVDYAVHLYRAGRYAEMQKVVNKVLDLDASNWQGLWYQVKLSELYNDQQGERKALKDILHFYPFSQLARTKLNALTTREAPAGAQAKPKP